MWPPPLSPPLSPPRRWRLLLAGLALGALSAGCDGSTAVDLSLPNIPDRFVVIAAHPDGAVDRAVCDAGQGGQGALACVSNGVHVASAQGLVLTVKAHGFEYLTLPLIGDEGAITHALAPLAPPEQTDAMATGLGEGAPGRDAFDTLAVSFDTELGPARVVKFIISDLGGRPRLTLQNTRQYPLHFEFYRDVLKGPDTPAEFMASTYSGEARQRLAGTLLRYPALHSAAASVGGALVSPVVLTFFPSDNLSPALARRAHQLVEERLGFIARQGGADRLVYLPAGDAQRAALEAERQRFLDVDAPYVLPTELYGGLDEQRLNPGVAYGRLRALSPEDLKDTIVSFGDILILSRLPNALPIVGGTITEELQTPLAHVNVAARTRGTPNLALIGASTRPEIAPLIGQICRFEVTASGWSLRRATAAEATAFWAAHQKPAYLPQQDSESQAILGFDALHFADWTRVGVKAANLAELKQLLGPKAPDGFGVPFYYYDQHMAHAAVTAALCDAAALDCVAEGRTQTLCDSARDFCGAGAPGEVLWGYAARLVASSVLKTDTEAREASLDSLRYLIGHTPTDPAFAAALDSRIGEVFGAKKARLRSSTNAEDLPDFSGAGLYTSVSGTASGPKQASQRIRKVWASTWSWRAYEERSFWNVDHLAVRMGVCVNRSFPNEAANGVLITQNIADPTVAGMYVNVQLGETSVTNPVDGAVAEVFAIVPGPGGVQVARQRYSSLSPDAAILTDAEVEALYQTAATVQQRFAVLYGKDPYGLALDLEFKFHGPERALFIKQARPYTVSQSLTD